MGEEAQERANSLYRLGSSALARNDLQLAIDLLGAAAADGHPGALFRLALASLLTGADEGGEGDDQNDDAWFLIAEAARHGHGDAQMLLPHVSSRSAPSGGTTDEPEDRIFFEEIRRRLVPAVTGSPALPGGSVPREESELGDASAGVNHLVLVPAPAVPTVSPPASKWQRAVPAERPRLTALPGGLTLPVPDPPEVPVTTHGLFLPDGEQRWSVHALRPAVINRMARTTSAPAVAPARWRTTQRACDLLRVLQQADGIDTRTLAHRTGTSKHTTVQMLDWLREQRFVETVKGTHLPGPRLLQISRPDLSQDPLTIELTELRDDLRAAVYISAYTDGEIAIQQSSSSAIAPAVLERTPFGVSAHASAVGKSLLAQLSFAGRMDHLSRYPSIQLTDRTITNKETLLERLDDHGPHSAQFDLLEYSNSELCVAYSLGLPHRASSIALSLPVAERHRLVATAAALSRRATGLLLTHLLTEELRDPPAVKGANREAPPHEDRGHTEPLAMLPQGKAVRQG
ncbi:IclR family transcriptional regulator C-terminal domain-containing protein [Streptomyces sp. NPDC002734]|uniref:IclR family transcriptional regulator domain-containing protein n=1 Tax=Streptomyces sp. NPDC002734 TaxID=3154426 RepID=UPI00331F7D1D